MIGIYINQPNSTYFINQKFVNSWVKNILISSKGYYICIKFYIIYPSSMYIEYMQIRDYNIAVLMLIKRKFVDTFFSYRKLSLNKSKLYYPSHSGFSAAKLENQNEFTNGVNNISMLSISEGVAP